jgi:hypothetical protein
MNELEIFRGGIPAVEQNRLGSLVFQGVVKYNTIN